MLTDLCSDLTLSYEWTGWIGIYNLSIQDAQSYLKA